MNQFNKWDRRFLDLADFVASWSKDPSTKVGAVIVRPDRTIASMGYNGFPRGADDSYQLYDNRETKYTRVVHAEANALLTAREPLHGYTLCTSMMPCVECTKLALQAGIKRFVSNAPTAVHRARWGASFAAAETLITECGATRTLYHT